MARRRAGKHRFFVADLRGERVALAGAEGHHAVNVLRLDVGADIELLDGRGGVARGEIVEIRKSRAVVRIGQREMLTDRIRPLVHLAFAVPKGKRLDWLLEKTTELAVASLHPVIFERSVAGGGDLSDARRGRWRSHCIAAAKQSGLNFLPDILDPVPLKELLAPVPGSDSELRLFGDISDDALPLPLALGPETFDPQVQIRFVVGPEGGLTDPERDMLVGGGFQPVRIGPTTLRIETAAVALLATIAAVCGSASPG